MPRLRCWLVLLVVLFVCSLIPLPAARAEARVSQPVLDVPEPPALPTSPTVVDKHLPSLSVSVATASAAIALGQTTTISVTVTNHAPDAAQNVAISLPVPAGTEALSTDALVSASQGWRWSIGQLAGGASTTVRADVRLATQPPGDALLARASVTARGVATPLVAAGGAIVRGDAAAATAGFATGRTATLRSQNDRLTVRVPGDAAGRDLVLRQAWHPAPGERVPPALVGHKRGFGTFYLNATDSRPVHRRRRL